MASNNDSVILTALSTYIDQISAKKILSEIVLTGHTNMLVSKMPNVKFGQTIPVITSNLVITQASSGIFSPTGSVTLSQQTLQVCDLMSQEFIPLNGANTLEQYWTNNTMTSGSTYDSLTPKIFASVYVSDKTNKLQDFIEFIEWQGVGAAGSTYSSLPPYDPTQCTGFLYQLEQTGASASIVTTTFSSTTFNTPQPQYSTTADAISILDNLYAVIPTNLKDQPDLVAFMSYANFTRYTTALRNKNFTLNNLNPLLPGFPGQSINDAQAISVAWNVQHPGTNLRVVATSGLSGCDNKIVIGPAKNFWFGYDSDKDSTSFRIWKSEDMNAILFRALFKAGTQVAYPQYCVVATGK
jgi:hypothetical protein